MFCQQAEELAGVLLARVLLLVTLHHELLGVDALVAGMANVSVADRPFQAFTVISWLISVIASACSQAEKSGGGQGLGVFIQCFEVSSLDAYDYADLR